MPEYSLAPQAHYPRQMQQGVETLRYTIEELGRDPSNIFIGGDSAGGNLTLAILSHVLHPHPRCPRLSLSSPLKGVILLAPWASFDTTWESVTTNANKDVVTKYIGDLWSANYLGPSVREEYNEPIRANVEWWSDLPKIVEEIITVGGKDEILVDSIKVMAGKLEVCFFFIVLNFRFHSRPLSQDLTARCFQEGASFDFIPYCTLSFSPFNCSSRVVLDPTANDTFPYRLHTPKQR